MRKTTAALLFGGCSPEYDVSLQSAYGVAKHVDTQKYDLILIGITRNGEWYRYLGDLEKLPDGSWYNETDCVPAVISPDRGTKGLLAFHGGGVQHLEVDLAFPVLHGKNGEDGTVQGLLELAGIPTVGCGVLCSALCMDKDVAHRLAESMDVAVPASAVLSKGTDAATAQEKADALGYPLFVKPARAGSSFGISKVTAADQVQTAVELAALYDTKIVMEQGVDGFEVGCAVLGNEELITGEVDEIEAAQGFFDYIEKYTLQASKIHMPARIEAALAQRVKETAKTLYRGFGCQGFARVDLFVTGAGDLVFNEINTIPGMTAHSRYPNMMRGVGLSFSDLVDRLMRLAV